MDSDVRELALDTLYNRGAQTAGSSDSCFIFNEAAERLHACGFDAVKTLEELMSEVVVPAMDKHREQNGIPDWSSMVQEGPPFAGLDEFLGAYWIICARTDPYHAVEFINKLTRPVVNEAVSILALYYHPANSLSDGAIPTQYVEYIQRLCESDVDEFRDVGTYVSEKLGLNESAK